MIDTNKIRNSKEYKTRVKLIVSLVKNPTHDEIQALVERMTMSIMILEHQINELVEESVFGSDEQEV